MEATGGLKWAFGGFARMLICAPGMQPGRPQARFRWIQRHQGAPRKRRGAILRQISRCFCSPPAQKGLKIKAKWLRTHRARSLRRARSVKIGSQGRGVSGAPQSHRDGEERVHLGGQAGQGQGPVQLLVTMREHLVLSGEFGHDMSHFGSSGQYACTVK